MLLANYKHQDETGMGLILEGCLFDLRLACQHLQLKPPASEIHELGRYLDVEQNEGAGWSQLVPVVDKLRELNADQTEGISYPLTSIQLLPPIRQPSKIICIGLNYADHCREQNIEVPRSPTIFVKFPSAIIGPGESIHWPKDVSDQVDYEAELAVVIGRQARNIPAKDAFDFIAGYTIVNDISARDVQFADKQWVRGKSFDTFCPMGPVLVSADQIENPNALDIKCRVNGETLQDSNTSEMIFQIPDLIEFISKTCTLLPGDVISTGTPAGVGVFRDPPIFLQMGDEIEVEIEGIGILHNRVA